MVWWTITKPTVGEATKKQAHADKVIDNLVHMYGLIGGVSAGASGGSLVPNGSFESDEDSDGIPDGWSETEYTAGAGSYETTDIGHGRKAYKFVSPGATGGGDLTTTDFFPVTQNRSVVVDFLLKCSAAGVHVLVELLWFTEAEGAASPSSIAVYDSTANPTSWAAFRVGANPPAGARLAKLRLVGAKNDTATAGTVYFDGVLVSEANSRNEYVTMAEISTGTSTTGTATLRLPSLSSNGVVRITLFAESHGASGSASMHFGVGAFLSNSLAGVSGGTYGIVGPFFIHYIGAGGDVTLTCYISTDTGTIYARMANAPVMVEVLVP
jgi:hypothetical protein